MDALIDILVGALPFIIFVLWIVRLVSRRKSKIAKRTSEKTESSENTVQERAPEPENTAVVKQLQMFEKKVNRMFTPERERLKAEPEKVVVSVKKVIPMPAANKTRRMVEDIPETADITIQNPEERITNLSPLAQGMIWSFILDKPPALKAMEALEDPEDLNLIKF